MTGDGAWFCPELPDSRGRAAETYFPHVTVSDQERHEVGMFADAVMRLVDQDIADGTVPADVASFAALHDYVDANMYLVDAAVPYRHDTDEGMALVNVVCDEVHARLAARTAGLCAYCGDWQAAERTEGHHRECEMFVPRVRASGDLGDSPWLHPFQ